MKTKAFDCALRLLMRREHGLHELSEKLIRKGHDRDESMDAVHECQRLGYQSDERFVESFCNVRIRQGYGPLRISQELDAKQIARELISTQLSAYEDSWEAHALAAWQKKFESNDVCAHELQKQQRFLLYRGFPADIISKVLKKQRV